MRVHAVQVWPELRNALPTPTLTARLTSASSRITLAALPPSSSATLAMRSAAAWVIARPVAVEPVNDTMSTPGCAAIAAPTSGAAPVTESTPPARTPRLVGRVEQQVGDERRQLARLEHDRAARRQGRRDLG